MFRMHLEQQLSDSKRMLRDFKSHEVLYMELMSPYRLENPETLPAIRELSNVIAQMEKLCGDAITRLEQETKEMISLVGIAIPIHMNVPTDAQTRPGVQFGFHFRGPSVHRNVYDS